MTVTEYVKDRISAYVIRAITLVIAIIFLMALRASRGEIVIVAVVFTAAVFLTDGWDYVRKRDFYNRLRSAEKEIDKKYLLPELIDFPNFYEGKMFLEILRACGKSMTEHVADYRKESKDFREYIELWVHEAKIPVAALTLISHNNPDTISEKMNVQLKRIDDCIENVLYYARSENAEKDYIIKEISLKKTFSNVAVKNREVIQLAGGTIRTENLDTMVMTDGKWLEFILGQLIANSIKYASPERPLELFVFAKSADRDITLHFRDNGIGIVEQDLPYAFDKTFTGHNGRKDADSTGMGLYIVKNLCDRLGHHICISSTENEYTEVQITFGGNDFYKMD